MTAWDAGSDGAQVAAEAMPYDRHRRTECNTGPARPPAWLSSLWLPTRRGPAASGLNGRLPIGEAATHVASAMSHEVRLPAWNT
jgi:hypothetical protein